MADVHMIANKSQSDWYDFLAGNYRFQDMAGLWPFLLGSDGVNPQQEVIPLIGEGDPVAVLNEDQTLLQRMLAQAAAWKRDPLLVESYWYYWNINGENPRRSLLFPGCRINQAVSAGVTPQTNEEQIRLLRMLLIRHPFFESVVSDTDEFDTLSALGSDVSDLSLTAGTAAGRIASIGFTVIADAAITTIWAGIRPKYQHPATLFTPLWELEEAGSLGTDSTLDTDANGSGAGSNVIKTTFATVATLAQRGRITIANVLASDYDHMVGRYLVLLRYRTSATLTTFGIQLRAGYNAATVQEIKAPEYVTPATTGFYFLDMGIVTFPPGQIRQAGSPNIGNVGLSLFAERLAGSGNLIWDCLTFIPADHMVKIDNASLTLSAHAYAYTHEDDVMSGLQETDNQPTRNLTLAATNWYIPIVPGYGGQLVVAGAEAGGLSVKTDTIDVDLEYVERWLDYRTS